MAWLKNIGHRDTKESQVVAKQLPSNGLSIRRKRTRLGLCLFILLFLYKRLHYTNTLLLNEYLPSCIFAYRVLYVIGRETIYKTPQLNRTTKAT